MNTLKNTWEELLIVENALDGLAAEIGVFALAFGNPAGTPQGEEAETALLSIADRIKALSDKVATIGENIAKGANNNER